MEGEKRADVRKKKKGIGKEHLVFIGEMCARAMFAHASQKKNKISL